MAGQTLHLFSVKLSLRLSPVRDIIFHHHHLHYHSLQLMFLLGLHFSPSIIIADTSDPVLFVSVMIHSTTITVLSLLSWSDQRI